MKITMHELLGLVKDSKAPKKINYGNVKLKYNEGCEDYYPYYGEGLFEYKFGNCKNFLNDEVEIIEEDRKIIRLEFEEGDIEDKLFLTRYITHNRAKINELIDEVNKLKGEK